MLGRPHRNVRMSMGLSLPKVLAFTPTEEFIEVRRADIKVTIGGSERDPLSSLGFGELRSAYLHRVNLRGTAFGTPLPVGFVSPLWGIKQWLLRAH